MWFLFFCNTFVSQIDKTMKKIASLLLSVAVSSMLLVSCGPSAEEKAKAEQAMKDSIATAIQKAMDDSLAMVQATADSIARIQAMEDSIRMVMEQEAQAEKDKPKPKPKPKPQPQPTKPEEVKPGQGRG